MQTAQQTFSIGEIAKILGLSIETLRRWDRSGKITVAKTAGGKRFFTQEDLELLKAYIKNRNRNNQRVSASYVTPKESISEQSTISSSGNMVNKFLLLTVLILVVVSSYFFTLTPLPHKAVLGVESFIAPMVEEGGIIESFLSPIGRIISQVGSFVNARTSLFLVGLLDNSELGGTAISSDLKVDGNIILGSSISNSLTINPETITFALSDKTLDITGDERRTLTILNSTEGQVADLNLSDGDLKLNGITRITNNGTGVFANLISDSLNISSILVPNSGTVNVTGSLSSSGTINGDTLNSTTLVFSGSSPSIYPSTAGTGISLNAGTTGSIDIGNSSTGDIYLGGGSGSTGCTVTNSNGSFTCSSNITSGGNLTANGGYLTTNQTTAYLFNDTATTINLGAAGTAVNIGASSGTTTIENGLTVTGATTLSSTLAVTGATTLTGALTANGTGTFNSTTTFAGRPTFTKAPSLAHTGAWSIGSSNWNISDSSVYINPATIGAADNNLLGIAVNGSVKFAVDSEGDTYVNNLILAGSITSATTTIAGDLGVEGNTTLGDATTDTLTVNPATLTFLGGDKTIDITGAATRTLTILNSTSAQVADLNLSDGDLKLGGTVRISNAGAGTFTTLTGSTSITDTGLTTIGIVTNTAGGLLGTTTGTDGQLLIGKTGATPLFATLSSDATISNTGALTLANSGVTAASYGGATAIPVLTIDAKGRITSASTASITTSTAWSALTAPTTDLTLTMAGYQSTFNFSGTTGTQQTLGTTDSAATGTTTVNSLGVNLVGTNNAAGTNTINGINFANVTAKTNNTFNALNFGTGFTNFINSGTFVLTGGGALSGATTLSLSGAITGATATNTLNGLIINSGALSGITTITGSGNINTTGGALQTNTVTRIDNNGAGTLASLSLTTALTVPNGGTGAGTFTTGGVLTGNGTSAVQVTSAGTAGQVLTSNGTGVAPTFKAAPLVAVAGSYAGNGAATRTIVTGFTTIKAVVIMASQGRPSGWLLGPVGSALNRHWLSNASGTDPFLGGAAESAMGLSGGDFIVATGSPAINDWNGSNGEVYTWLAWGY